MIDRFHESLRFQSTALELRSQRQAVIASNIANADTPGYKAVDADFSAALKRRMAAEAPVAAPSTNSASPSSMMPTTAAGLLPREVRVTSPAEGAQDGNGVDMDVERARFA